MENPAVSEAGELAERIRSARGHLLEQVRGLTESRLRSRPDSDAWSVIEVVAHLADVDLHWLEQALAIRDNADHVFVHFDDAHWKLEHPTVRDLPPAAVFQAAASAHETVLETLGRLTDDDLQRTAKHPRRTPYSVSDVFLRYPVHDQNHAEQIASIRGRLGA